MSPIKSFITAWFAENYEFEGYPAPPGKRYHQSEYMAQDCFEAAAELGISRQKITEEIGDLMECTARGFWDTGLNPMPPRRAIEAACDGTRLA